LNITIAYSHFSLIMQHYNLTKKETGNSTKTWQKYES